MLLCTEHAHTKPAPSNRCDTSHAAPDRENHLATNDAEGSVPSSARPAHRAGKGPAEGPLGIYPKSVGHFDDAERIKAQEKKEKRRLAGRRELYADLKSAAMILRNDRPDKIHAVAKCRWMKIAGSVSLHLTETHAGGEVRGSFRGVKICGNVWGCPVCSARISQKRRQEANDALAWGRAVGAIPVMITLTARHGRKDRLGDLLDGMKLAKRSLRQHRTWRGIKGRILGTITATETTHGTSHGWHPHFHEILFIDAKDEAEALALVEPLGDAWRASLRGRGLDGASAAFDAQGASVAGDYVAKWGAGEELTLTGSKKGRKAGRSPRQLLRLAGEGDASARHLWLEYFKATSGRRRRQLVWSPGLKDAVGINDVSDEEAATEEADAREIEPVAEWDGAGWRRVRSKRVSLLEAAERGGREAVKAAESGPDDQPGEEAFEVIEPETDHLTAADMSAAFDEVHPSARTVTPAAAVQISKQAGKTHGGSKMDRQEYFQQKISGIDAEFAGSLAYTMKLQDACDAAMFPGAYRRTLRFAADALPALFLEDRYISEITDPETGRIKGEYVVPFRDWAVSITQEALLNMDGEFDTGGEPDTEPFMESVDRVISKFREERVEAAKEVADAREHSDGGML